MGDRAVPRTEHERVRGQFASIRVAPTIRAAPAIRPAPAIGAAPTSRTAPVAAGALTVTLLVLLLTAITASAAASNGASAWGLNSSGQLGNGTTTNSNVAVEVHGLSAITAVAAGSKHSLALLSNGEVMAWGGNE